MKKGFIVSGLLAGVLFLMGCDQQNSTTNTPKIAVVDMAALMRDSEPGKSGIKFIEDQQAAATSQLEDLRSRLEKNPQDTNAIQEFQTIYAQSSQRVQEEGQQVAAQIINMVQRVLDDYRTKNGYELIIPTESLATFNPSLDITKQMLEEINKQTLDFAPAAKQAPASPAPFTPAQ